MASQFNAIEIVLWSLIGIGFGLSAFRVHGANRTRSFILAVAFLLFALSDWIEIQTGAWWRPFWLLLLKAGCIATFFLVLRSHLKSAERQDD